MTDVLLIPAEYKDITFAIEMTGSNEAVRFLEHNTLNRDIKQSHVAWLARLMRDDQFMISSDAVCVSVSGRVLNGQHRLWAVIESGKTVPLVVARGYPESAQRVIDTGLRRSSLDTAKIDGMVGLHRGAAAVARVMMQHGSGYNIRLVSNVDVSDYLKAVRESIDFAAHQVFNVSQTRGFSVSSLHAVVAQAYYSQDRDALRAFGEVVVTGQPNRDPGSRAVILLREYLIKPQQGARTGTAATYRRTQTALDAYLRNNTLRVLDECRAQLFPLPTELFRKGA